MDLKIIMPDFPVVYSVLSVILPSTENNGGHLDFKLGLFANLQKLNNGSSKNIIAILKRKK